MEVRNGYVQTEAGIFPADWPILPLKKISPKQGVGLVINPSTYFDRAGTVPLLVGSNVSEGVIDANLANRITAASNSMLSASRLAAGDLVTVRVGEPGVTAVVPPSLDNSNCASMMIVRKHASFNSHWLCAVMNSRLGRRQVEHVQYGTAQKQFNISDAVNFKFATPPRPEQNAIAGVIGEIDALLSGLDRLIAKKRDLKQAAMQQLLTGQTRLPGFQSKWEVKRLGETATLKARIGWQGLTTAEYLNSGNYYLVTGTEFERGYIAWEKCHFVDETRYKQDKYIQLRLRDVLVTKDGTIGKVALVSRLDGPATLNSGVFVIRPLGDAFSPEFFYFMLCSQVFSDFLGQLAAGSTINHLYQKDFVSFSYRTPPTIKEQMAIAAVLSDMDAELMALESRRDKTRALKQGMMQELLTGRTRLV